MSVLDKIIAHKHLEVQARKAQVPVSDLERSALFSVPARSLSASLQDPAKSAIITEFKRKSPSKGVINGEVSVKEVTMGYAAAGSSGLSVLTDGHFFGGSMEDLLEARRWNDIPILRKDFVVEEYQVLEAKAIGADAVLLIAACLDSRRLQALAELAGSLGMEVLMEVHDREELGHYNPFVHLVGVNNRNLKTMEVSVQTSFDLFDEIPSGVLAVSESGIDDPALIVSLKQLGYRGFLMGEYFMKHAAPQDACRVFIQEVKRLEDLTNHAIA